MQMSKFYRAELIVVNSIGVENEFSEGKGCHVKQMMNKNMEKS